VEDGERAVELTGVDGGISFSGSELELG
jgi:hypothetical protein